MMVVLFDFDEVFVDINTGALRYINAATGANWTMDDLVSWDFYDRDEVREPFLEYLSQPDIYQKDAIPNEGMIGILKQMVEQGDEVYIVTASVESSAESKYRFIREKMPFFDTGNLFTVNPSSRWKMKSDVLDELALNYHEPIVLVDDGIHNILDMMADIKHKAKLDGMMKQHYAFRTLKKFNNPYHDFIYGIVPELVYNKSMEDGKRIFKLRDSSDIWMLFKKIRNEHKARVENKQAELFSYLNSVTDAMVPEQELRALGQQVGNVAFVAKHLLNKTNKHASFLRDIAAFTVRFNKILESGGYGIDKENDGKIAAQVIKMVFGSADKNFDSDVMYNEVKNLIVGHSVAREHFKPVEVAPKKKIENYFITKRNADNASKTLLGEIIEISQANVDAARSAIYAEKTALPEELKAVFESAGVHSEVDFSDKPMLYANLLLAFNKNFTLSRDGSIEAKSQIVESFRAKNGAKGYSAPKQGKKAKP